MNRFQKTLAHQDHGRPPVWFMRQAGRYHAHYQNLKKDHSFIELCKNPKLACEVTLGPIEDFKFDAAILFSDLLFPLETLGMGLTYDVGPKLDWHLKSLADLKKIRDPRHDLSRAIDTLKFQAEAIRLIRPALPQETGLIGFVGSPLTLFFYAVQGSHQGADFSDVILGLKDGRFKGFCDRLLPLLLENMVLQARAGIDALAVFDTCAGDVELKTYQSLVVPVLRELFQEFKRRVPEVALIYYSRGTHESYWRALKPLAIDVLGIDWRTPLPKVLEEFSERFMIQGNYDPTLLTERDPRVFEASLREYFRPIRTLSPLMLKSWICGLGHGVLKETPEANVRKFLQIQSEVFGNL